MYIVYYYNVIEKKKLTTDKIGCFFRVGNKK